MDKKLSELLRIWNKLNDKNKQDLLNHMRQQLANQNNQKRTA